MPHSDAYDRHDSALPSGGGHIDPDTLAVLALGDPPAAADADHLALCPPCRADLAELAAVVELGEVRGELQRPGAQVWDRIAAEIAAGDVTVSDESASPDLPAVVHLGDARRRRKFALPLTIAASIAAGAAGVLAVQALLPAATPPRTVLVSAELEPLPGWAAAGVARIEDADGDRILRVELPDATPTGYREVWLISSDLERLISLGVLTGDVGSFDIPGDLDLDDFSIVDVSDEPINGDPSHSGNSIARGQLA